MRLPMTLTTRSSSEQPTVMTLRLMPGVVMVPRFGPMFPAATTTTKPASQISSTPRTRADVSLMFRPENEPTDTLTIRMLNRSRCCRMRWRPAQDIGNIAAAPFVQHLDRNEVAAGSDAAEPAFAGTAVPGDDAADMSAVSVIIIRQLSSPYHIKKGGDPFLIVFVGKAAGIQYGYPNAASGGVVRTGSREGKWGPGSWELPAFLLLWYSGEALPVRVHT